MIGQLTGKITFTGSNFVILDVASVGYKVFVSAETARALAKNEGEATLRTHLVVRENVLDLYGFPTQSELEFFETLITISGIGPKSALGVLHVAPVDTLKSAVASGDTSYLTKVSGIGKKMAEKIVVELKDTFGDGTERGTALRAEESAALEALEALGYKTAEAREVLKHVPEEAESTEEKVKAALKNLGGS